MSEAPKKPAPQRRPTPAQQAQQVAAADAVYKEADAAATRAEEAAAEARRAANAVNRRIPVPAPVKIVVGAPPARGVPRKFNAERQRIYFDALARGIGRSEAAALAGVSRQTIKNYRESDPDFRAAEEDAERSACDLVEETVFELATTGRNFEAARWWLINRLPDRWKAAQKLDVNVTGSVEHIDVTAALADIEQLEAAWRQRLALRNGEAPALEAGAVDAEVVEDED